MDTVNIRIAELPQRHQEPFRQWLIEQGHTQLTLDEKEPHAYAYVVDYQKWLRIGNHE